MQRVEFHVDDTSDNHYENKISEMYQKIRTLNELDKAIIFLFLEGTEVADVEAFKPPGLHDKIPCSVAVT